MTTEHEEKEHPWGNRSLLTGVHFTLCLTPEQFAAVCKKLDVKADWHASNHGSTYHFENDGKHVCVVAIRDWKERPSNQVLALIVHEAAHVWQRTMRIAGENYPGDEIEAYAMQNITQELFDMFDELSK